MKGIEQLAIKGAIRAGRAAAEAGHPTNFAATVALRTAIALKCPDPALAKSVNNIIGMYDACSNEK